MTIKTLNVHPVKSLRAISVKSANVLETGFEHDREFMVVDKNGKFITQRQCPQMATIQVEVLGEDKYRLVDNESKAGNIEFKKIREGRFDDVAVWQSSLEAVVQDDEVNKWLQQALGLDDIKLVTTKVDEPRIKQSSTMGGDIPVSFADGYPFLITNTASLRQLNEWYQVDNPGADAIPMSRFRSNIVLDTGEPFSEDSWKIIRIGDIRFELVKPCVRCVMITIDQKYGVRDQVKTNILRTLAQNRPDVSFGYNAVPLDTGQVSLNDVVEIVG